LSHKIGYLISQYPTLSHSFIFREIRELRNLGLDIEVASIRNPDRPIDQLTTEEKPEAERTYYIRADAKHWPLFHLQTIATHPGRYLSGLLEAIKLSKGNLGVLARHLRFFGEAVTAGQWFRARGIGLIHTHFASLTTLLIARIFGTAVSMTIHGSDEFIDPVGFCMAEKVHAAKLVIGISRYGCSQIMRFSEPEDWYKVAMVRLGIDPENFQPASPQPSALFRIICVGRLVPVKAYGFLIGAAAELTRRGHAVKLTIVGGGPERERLERLGGNVEFTGALPNDAVRARLRESDCFALASFAEGVPVVLMEAMALELPCVATRVTGVPELIEDGVEGVLVPPADAQALADAIERLIVDPDLRRQIATNGRRKVLDQFDLSQNARELRDRLTSVTPT
jgi:colanic acid/amylovoran biosynthesis glycosyltransferase